MTLRIQLSRAKGWRMPVNTLKVDRSTPWGNPFTVGRDGTQLQCVELYAFLMNGLLCLTSGVPEPVQRVCRDHVAAHAGELRGLNLACWCRLCPEHKAGRPAGLLCTRCAPCHADVLLRIANV